MIPKIMFYRKNIGLFCGSIGCARENLMTIYPWKMLSGRGPYKSQLRRENFVVGAHRD
jgi:hypothetical protein